MMRKRFTTGAARPIACGLLACALTACGNDHRPPAEQAPVAPAPAQPAPAPAEPALEPTPEQLPLEQDFTAQVEQQITADNFRAELDTLEKEIQADASKK
jgi:hypothetical protein